MHSIHHLPPDHLSVPKDCSKSFVICPMRSFDVEPFQFPNMDRMHHIVQVRDPRDVLVSDYYSLGWSHTDAFWGEQEKLRRDKIQAMSADEFVLGEEHTGKPPLLDRMSPILELSEREDVTIVKYETMVLDFPAWLDKTVAACQISSPEALKRRLTIKYKDEFTPDENPNGHKRNVTPGDHRDKLTGETIKRLNTKFGPILDCLDYSGN